MGVIMQAFYWDCPKLDNKEFHWWEYVESQISSLKSIGITSLWLPPVSKPPNIFEKMSMGYDPYDYYDLGDIPQCHTIPTWFGSKQALLNLINSAHQQSMQVYADVVINHNNGADQQDGNSRWTLFNPGSGKFKRNWECFHPSRFDTVDESPFEDMPDLCHKNPYVFDELLKLSKWMVEEIGFDGFRYDFVKGYGAWMIAAIQDYRYTKNSLEYKPFGVAENWDESEEVIGNWLEAVNNNTSNSVRAFDFPLRVQLKQLCDGFGYNLENLKNTKTLFNTVSALAVTFVDNHDFDNPKGQGYNPIFNDKMLAYAFILTHEGYPCVFWRDYYNYGLGKPNSPNGIAKLVQIHESHAGGTTSILYVDRDLYVMQRNGVNGQPGLILVLNNQGDRWNGQQVTTKWLNTKLIPHAWGSNIDTNIPSTKITQSDGAVDLWAPPRGYVVYLPTN